MAICRHSLGLGCHAALEECQEALSVSTSSDYARGAEQYTGACRPEQQVDPKQTLAAVPPASRTLSWTPYLAEALDTVCP